MRRGTTVTMVAAAALLLAACGDQSDDDAVDERVAELEAELDGARQDAEDLLEENERLRDEAAGAGEDAPDDGDATDDPSDDTDDDTVEDDAPPSTPTEPQPERTPEGLVEQVRTLFGLDEGPDGGWEPGATEWIDADVPPDLDESYDSPGALAADLLAALDAQSLGADTWESTTRVLLDEDDPDQAYVAVLSWGLADDAVVGRDLRMTITQEDDVWAPGGAEERYHCRRGVSDEDLCV